MRADEDRMDERRFLPVPASTAPGRDEVPAHPVVAGPEGVAGHGAVFQGGFFDFVLTFAGDGSALMVKGRSWMRTYRRSSGRCRCSC